MAIKRINPDATFDIVSVHDEAIEFESDEELEALKTGKKDKSDKDTYNASRYDKYLESFDLNELKFKEGQKPTLFRVRCLKSEERASLDQRYQVVDVVNKRLDYKNKHEMMLELFNKAVVAIQNEAGEFDKPNADELEYKVKTDIGAAISLLGSLGKNLKKA